MKASVLICSLTVLTAPVFAAEVNVSNCTTAKAWQDAFNKADVAGVVNLYSADAIEVTPAGVRMGKVAIKERVEASLKASLRQVTIPVRKCIVDGRLRLSVGDWSDESPQGRVSGFWSAVEAKQGSAWKLSVLTYNMTPPPSAAKAQ